MTISLIADLLHPLRPISGITGLLLVLASSALGIYRWLSHSKSDDWLLQWQFITILGFYMLSLDVGAWMVPDNLHNLDTAVLVIDTLIVLALLIRLISTLEAQTDYDAVGCVA